MGEPKRIQRERAKGWRLPEGAVSVVRPSRFGMPYGPGYTVAYRKFGIVEQFTIATAREAVDLYRRWLAADPIVPRSAFNAAEAAPTTEDIRGELAGKDLACWCPLNEPCHADVLLEIANGGEPHG